MARDKGIGWVELCLNPGSNRAKRVKTFGAGPLPVRSLEITGSYIVGDGVAENCIKRVSLVSQRERFPTTIASSASCSTRLL